MRYLKGDGEQRAERGGNKKRRACFSAARRATRLVNYDLEEFWKSDLARSINTTLDLAILPPPLLAIIILPTFLLPLFIYFNSMLFRKLDDWLIVFQSSIFPFSSLLFLPFLFLVTQAMCRSKILKKKKIGGGIR